MGVILGIISLVFERLWDTLPPSPYFSSFYHGVATAGILAVGGVIAFCMVWAEFTLIANTSALTFMVAGTFKEIVTVGAAVLFLHEEFTAINAIGLGVLVAGVVLFNYLKYQKLRQGEIRPIPMEDGLPFRGGGAGGAGQTAKGKNAGVRDPGNGVVSYSNSNGNSTGSALELVPRTYTSSRPASPHSMTEANLRRVFVLQEDEDASLMSPTLAVRREQSI